MPAGGPSTCYDKKYAGCVMLLHMCKFTPRDSQRVLQRDTDRLSAVSYAPKLTLQAVGSVSELQSEVVVGGAVGVQRPRHLPAADEAVLPAQHDDRAVNQLHEKLLGLTCRHTGRNMFTGRSECKKITVSDFNTFNYTRHNSLMFKMPNFVPSKTDTLHFVAAHCLSLEC